MGVQVLSWRPDRHARRDRRGDDAPGWLNHRFYACVRLYMF
jgi:hypothetical protein